MVKHSRLAKIHENRESFPLECFDVYGIVTDADCDYGSLFQHFYNVSQRFYDVPYTSLFDCGII